MFVDLEFNTAYSAIDRTAKVQLKKNTIIRQFKRYIVQMFAGFARYQTMIISVENVTCTTLHVKTTIDTKS